MSRDAGDPEPRKGGGTKDRKRVESVGTESAREKIQRKTSAGGENLA